MTGLYGIVKQHRGNIIVTSAQGSGATFSIHGGRHQMAPDIKMPFISGYTEDYLGRKSFIDSSTTLVSKPFLPEDLLRKVNEVLQVNGAN